MTLREATADKHKIAEKMPFNQLMFAGQLSNEQYLEYLKAQYTIFKVIEARLLLPINMIRSGSVLKDIHELVVDTDLKVPITSDITKDYVKYLTNVDEKQLWAHVYLNYLAITFGGQMIKSKVPGSGNMYDFENIQDIIKFIRERQDDSMSDEVNRGFDFIIEIFDRLHKNFINV